MASTLDELQHTLGHDECPACEKEKRAVMHETHFGSLPFREAAPLWLNDRKGLAPRTRTNYLEYFKSLNLFFGAMRLCDIEIFHVRAYVKVRQAEVREHRTHVGHRRGDGEQESDGASRVNHEISTLGQIMAEAGLWQEIKRRYKPLPLPREGPGIAVTKEEEDHLMSVASSRTKWRVTYCCWLISRGTTAGPGEILHLRLKDIEMDRPIGDGITRSFIHIRQCLKNEFRERPLPVTGDAEKALRWALEHAAEMGAHLPEHYLFPHRALNRKSKPDPTRPMGSFKKAHRAICLEAAKKFPRLARLRPYDWRHTAATDLLENPGVSYATIEHMMGHRISSKTKRKYDHLRDQALTTAASVLDHGHTAPATVFGEPQRSPVEAKPPAKAGKTGNLYQFPRRNALPGA